MWRIVTIKAEAPQVVFVTETVRVPDPVYRHASQEAERKDVSRGAVIREWMEKAEQYDNRDRR